MKSKVLTGDVTRAPSNALGVWGVTSYRASFARQLGSEPVLRVSVELEVMNTGPWPWTPVGAALSREGASEKVLKVRAPVSIQLEAPTHPVVVETELTEGEARGTYTLRLWDASGARLIVLGGVTFP